MSALRAHAALWREIADAAWSACRQAVTERLDERTISYALEVANLATKLAHRLEHAGGDQESV